MALASGVLWAADHVLRARAIAGPAATGVAVAAGVSATVVGFLVHEWGHLAGATWSGGTVEVPETRWSPLLFRFDTAVSSRRQFVAMSVGGFAATALVATTIGALAPASALSGKVALGLTGAAILATAVGEGPIFLRVLRGDPLPTGAIFAGE